MKFTTGSIVGGLTKGAILGTSYLSKNVSTLTDKIISDKNIKKKIKINTNKFSKILEKNAIPISEKIDHTITNLVLKSEEVGGKLSKNIAKKMDASQSTIENCEKCGSVVGKAIASGLTASACVIAAGTTAVTTGASVFTHGMATLGLGSMYVGLATVSVIAGSVYNTKKAEKKKKIRRKTPTKRGQN